MYDIQSCTSMLRPGVARTDEKISADPRTADFVLGHAWHVDKKSRRRRYHKL
jgi:hypothetical protein